MSTTGRPGKEITYMKLHELLASYKGQELSSDMIAAISSQVDVHKEAAVDKAVSKFKDYEDMKTELQTFRDEKSKTEFKETWTEAGGNPDANLDDYNLDNYKGEDGKLNHEALFKAHPHLKGEATPATPNDPQSVFSAITSVTGGNGKQAGDGEPQIKVY